MDEGLVAQVAQRVAASRRAVSRRRSPPSVVSEMARAEPTSEPAFLPREGVHGAELAELAGEFSRGCGRSGGGCCNVAVAL